MTFSNGNNLAVRPVRTRQERRDFLRVPWQIYHNDPHWIPPLLFDVKKTLNPKKNPYFHHAQAELFVAYRHATPVGRISAQVDQLFLEKYQDPIGFFGFFESIEDPRVARSLMQAAGQWLAKQGMKKIRGPFNLSINATSGVLVKGFDSSPMVLMTYNPPYYDGLLGQAGLNKAKDLYAWHYRIGDISEPVRQIAEAVREYPGLTIRNLDKKNLERDLHIIMDVFNSAWSENWGFIPLTEAEIRHAAHDLKAIVRPEICLIAEVEGKPAGIVFSLPNLHEVIRDFNGHLFPWNLFRLLYRLKFRPPKNGRLAMLGIKKEYRGGVLGGLSLLLYVEVNRGAQQLGYTTGELSWTLEDNQKVNEAIKFMGGEHYKTYRIYEKSLL